MTLKGLDYTKLSTNEWKLTPCYKPRSRSGRSLHARVILPPRGLCGRDPFVFSSQHLQVAWFAQIYPPLGEVANWFILAKRSRIGGEVEFSCSTIYIVWYNSSLKKIRQTRQMSVFANGSHFLRPACLGLLHKPTPYFALFGYDCYLQV